MKLCAHILLLFSSLASYYYDTRFLSAEYNYMYYALYVLLVPKNTHCTIAPLCHGDECEPPSKIKANYKGIHTQRVLVAMSI